jgi:hypothetical protein
MYNSYMWTDQEGMVSGARWGIYLVIAALLFPFQRFINIVFDGSLVFVALLTLIGFVGFISVAAAMHTRGFVYLAQKYDYAPLRRASRALCVLYLIYGFLMSGTVVAAVLNSESEMWNAFIGLTSTVALIVLLILALSVFKLYAKMGIASLSIFLFPFWVLVLWYGWPVALLALPSTYLLYRESSS